MLGIKIFDGDSYETTTELINFAKNENLCIEVALYGNNVDFIKYVNSLPNYINNPNKILHLDYRKYVVGNILQNEKYLNSCFDEIKIANQIQINKGVIHYQNHLNLTDHLENFIKDKITNNLKMLHSIGKEKQFVFYIENTFIHQKKWHINNLQNHRIIWDTIIENNYEDYLGMCLDWGHVKSFTNDSLKDWLEFVEYLKNKNVKIHMHIHDNNADDDLHIPLKEAFEIGLDKFNHVDDIIFIEYLKNIHHQYKDEFLILENSSHQAKENILWIKEYFKL